MLYAAYFFLSRAAVERRRGFIPALELTHKVDIAVISAAFRNAPNAHFRRCEQVRGAFKPSGDYVADDAYAEDGFIGVLEV